MKILLSILITLTCGFFSYANDNSDVYQIKSQVFNLVTQSTINKLNEIEKKPVWFKSDVEEVYINEIHKSPKGRLIRLIVVSHAERIIYDNEGEFTFGFGASCRSKV